VVVPHRDDGAVVLRCVVAHRCARIGVASLVPFAADAVVVAVEAVRVAADDLAAAVPGVAAVEVGRGGLGSKPLARLRV